MSWEQTLNKLKNETHVFLTYIFVSYSLKKCLLTVTSKLLYISFEAIGKIIVCYNKICPQMGHDYGLK